MDVDRLIETTYPSGRIVTLTRDSQGQVTGITTKSDSMATAVNVATSIDWQAFGPMTILTHGNGLVRIPA